MARENPVRPRQDKGELQSHRDDGEQVQTAFRPSVSFVTDTPRYGYVEHWTWRLKARPIQAKLEDDGDIHLVVSVPTAPAKTMIVEFPKRTCVASPFRRWKIAAARQAFVSNCGTVSSSSWLHLAGSVTITGVGFWDAKHGQTGVAPNGIELHPVLNFAGDCRPASTGGGGGGGGSCTPGYSPCLPLGPSDYDCYGGGGNGPAYTQPGVVYRVTGSDPYGLDSDNDGFGCEWRSMLRMVDGAALRGVTYQRVTRMYA